MRFLNSLITSLTLFFVILVFNSVKCQRTYSKEYVKQLREEVREMFQHAYNGYLEYASDYDELRPLSCDGVNTWGSYSLTLIDALDTLAVMGNYTEFRRVVKLLSKKINFDKDINVSVFETNIRIVGGLLSAHLMSHKAGAVLEPGWPCNGPLLRLAEDVARRLLPAFDTTTGMPYGTVNLKHGVPPGETSVTCTAGVGTFIVEFGALSRLTGDPIYEETALNALYSLWNHKSSIGLFGNHIDVQTGRWTAQDSGIGAGIDSYYEYLVKGAILLDRPELLEMFHEGRRAIEKYMKRDDWYVWVSMNKGQVTLPVFQSLEAYWPGVLSLIGETRTAMKTLRNYHSVWRQYGFLPEFYNIPTSEASANRESYPLRPELIESIMHLYRATKDQFLLEMGEDILKSIQYSARTKCGYATIKNVRDHRKEDRMESFFLAETTKYLYLLFDPDNFLNNDGGSGEVIDMPHGKCVIDAGGFVFNTEAHPIDPAALKCCYELPRQITLDLDFEKFRGDLLVFNDKEDVEYSCAKKQMQNAPESVVLDIAPQLSIKEIEKKTDDSQNFDPDADELLEALETGFSQEASDMLGIAIIDELLYKGFLMAIAPEKNRFKTIVGIMEKNMVMSFDMIKKVLKRIDDGTYDSADIQLIKTNHKDKNETFEIIMEYYVQHARMILHMNVINTIYHRKRSKGETYAKDIDTLHLTLEALRLSNEILLTPDNFDIYTLLLKAQTDYETYLTIKTLDAVFFSEMYEDAFKAFSEVGGRNATLNFNKKYDDYVKTKEIRVKELVVDRPTYNVYAKLEELIAEVKRNFTSENGDDVPTIIDLNEPNRIPEARPLKLKPFHRRDEVESKESQPTQENDDIIVAVDDGMVEEEEDDSEANGEDHEEDQDVFHYEEHVDVEGTFQDPVFEGHDEDYDEDHDENNAIDSDDDDEITGHGTAEPVIFESETGGDDGDEDVITGQGTVEPVIFESEKEFLSDTSKGTVEPVNAPSKSEALTDTIDSGDNEESSATESKSENLNGNTSILPDFVQTILKSTLPSRPKFDPQLFLEKIRAKGLYLDKKKNFSLFYCRAQPFVQRFTDGTVLT